MAKSDYAEKTASLVVQLLRKERERQKMSMEALAGKAGLALATISFTERGLRNPTLVTLLKIAEVLQVELGNVVLEAGEKQTRRGS